ncbi:MAG: hypothetical protein E7588_07995 [Ruminococcaceae bacterium]|nr:hypothetical protein [Oscillospiraceae bacterium]
MKKSTVHIITESGICIALATILSMIMIYHLPYGGSITAVSMLPICLFSYRNGIRAGLACGFVHGLLQMFLGITQGVFKGADLFTTFGMVVLDYLLAFGVLGFACLFRGKIKSHCVAFSLGCMIVGFARYVCHILSGYIFFKSYAEWFFSQEGFTLGEKILAGFGGEPLYWIYTLIYNGSFMIPEIILTTLAGLVVARYPKIICSTK